MVEDGCKRICVVSSRTLKPWLERQVPLSLSNVSVAINQVPELRVESQRPKYLSKLNRHPAGDIVPEGARVPDTEPPSAAATLRGLADIHNLGEYFAHDIEPRAERRQTPRGIAAFNDDMQRLLVSSGRAAFQTRTGFTVVGAEIAAALLDGDAGPCEIFHEGGVVQVRVRSDGKPGSVVLVFSDGVGACLAAIPGFIATVTVDRGLVTNVTYTPSRYTSRWHNYESNRADIETRRAFVAVAAKRGIFRIERGQAKSFSEYLRMFKSLDPTLGIYAAYGYYQGGLLDQVESVFEWMRNDPETVVPFDVALLAGHLSRRDLIDRRTAPVAPMLTQGFALLHEGLDVPAWLREAVRFTLPALWTTFSADGVNFVVQKLQQNGI
jgi:hypothetical protein